ncbi:MAG: NTP transferase domain-containing protein [Gammaproteobacteria bacterium]|nr:NTP transferase domain-containing protein [Gammaproteobacteria bacterium]
MKAIGALLAGGQSRRMGTDKALLPVGAGTLLDHMTARLRALDLAEVVVCRDAPGCIADRIPGQGPLGALHSLGIHYPGRDLLVVPVDMPLLSAATLAALLTASNESQRPRHYAGYLLPLWLPLSPAAMRAIETRVTDPAADRSLAVLLRTLSAAAIRPPGPPEEFANVNTPADRAYLPHRLHPLP